MTTCSRAPRNAPAAHGPAGAATPVTRPRHAARIRRTALLLAAPLLVLGLAACDPSVEQHSVRSHINESRRASGLHGLGDDPIVRYKAQTWAEGMAASGSLAHSALTSGLAGVGVEAVAENVGRGASTRDVHEAFMRSTRHRANILDRRWDRVGTGHAVGGDGQRYIVHVFVDLG